MERSIEYVIGYVAILKAGAAYATMETAATPVQTFPHVFFLLLHARNSLLRKHTARQTIGTGYHRQEAVSLRVTYD